jgi:hypothetical protein
MSKREFGKRKKRKRHLDDAGEPAPEDFVILKNCQDS